MKICAFLGSAGLLVGKRNVSNLSWLTRTVLGTLLLVTCDFEIRQLTWPVVLQDFSYPVGGPRSYLAI